MKTNFHSRRLIATVAAAVISALPASLAAQAPDPDNAAAPIEKETLTATGKVFGVEPDVLFVAQEKVSVPLNFLYTSRTPVVDESEKPVPWEKVRNGVPVTVEYGMLGDLKIATKIVFTRKLLPGEDVTAPDDAARKREELAAEQKRRQRVEAERARLLPVDGAGVIMGFEQVIAVRPAGSPEVVQYVVNNSTHYVDLAGTPVPLNMVRTGIPVNVQFVEDGGRRIATKFTLQRTIPPESVTSVQRGTAAPTASAGAPGATGTTTLSGVIPGGELVPDVLDEGFINPPVTVLPGAVDPALIRPGLLPATPTLLPPGTQPTQPGNQPTTQPPATQPVQPGTQPSGGQPATGVTPGVRPATGGTPAPRPATGTSPATKPAPAPAPR